MGKMKDIATILDECLPENAHDGDSPTPYEIMANHVIQVLATLKQIVRGDIVLEKVSDGGDVTVKVIEFTPAEIVTYEMTVCKLTVRGTVPMDVPVSVEPEPMTIEELSDAE